MTYNQLTKDDINEKLKEKCIEALDDYKDTKATSTFRCLICGEEFPSRYDNIRYWKGKGCIECQKKERSYKNKFNTLLKNKSKFVEIISFDAETNQVNCKCLVCGKPFTSSYASIKIGSMHKTCSSKLSNISNHSTFTLDDLLERIKENGHDISIIDFDIIDERVNCHCNVCDNKWKPKKRTLLSGRGCPECAKENRKLHRKRPVKDYNDILESFNLSFMYIDSKKDDEIITNITKIWVRCKKCKHEFPTTLYYLQKHNIGCTKCNEIERTIESQKRFVANLKAKNDHIILVGEYVDMSTPTYFKCTDCNKLIFKSPHDLLRCCNCPHCTTNSVLEYHIKTYLNDLCIDFELHKRFDDLKGVNNGLLSYDFFLPKYNILIEAQGIQHEKPVETFGGEKQFKIQQEHDERKRKYAQDNNYHLIEIWYNDITHIKQTLNEKLNINNNQKSA